MGTKERVVKKLLGSLICSRCHILVERDMVVYTDGDEILCFGCEAKRLSKIDML
jgi:formylmethanofuran dehydrogenase subunit E